MRITKTHYYFWNTIYSQWFMSTDKDYLFEENGIGFITAEHYMMYHKAIIFSDLETANKILKTIHPRDVKKLGRLVRNYDDSIWNEKRFNIVVNGNILKFSQNPKLLKDLMKYKDKIFVEASPEDKIWGIGLHYEDNRVLDEKLWQGQNLLGKAINKVIDVLLKEEQW